MSGQSEDDAWRSIVENYGERAEIDQPAEPEPRAAGRPAYDPVVDPEHDELDETRTEDRFVPPPPPPLPHPPPVRMAAWVALFGSPAALVLAVVLGVGLPSWVGYLLVGAFLGGFAYLVVTMQRGPRDPGDDGARL
jgi:hypothetical protein